MPGLGRGIRLVFIFTLLLALLSSGSCADKANILLKWSRPSPQAIGGIDVGDYNGDGKLEVVVGTVENNYFVMDNFGNTLSSFYLGNASSLGRVYSITSGDLNGNGVSEIILGLGGARVVNTYPIRGYDVTPGGGISNVQKSLYRTIRYYGGVYALGMDGRCLWNYSDITSVRSVHYAGISGSSPPVLAAGIGDQNSIIYAEHGQMKYDEHTCASQNFTDVVMGWGDELSCETPSICCSLTGVHYVNPTTMGLVPVKTIDYKDCRCRWDAAEDVCYGSYTMVTCGTDAEKAEPAWVFNEYPDRNGTILILNSAGVLQASYLYDGTALNSNVRCVYSSDIDGDGFKEVISGLSSNNLSVLRHTPGSSPSLRWGYNAGSEVRAVTSGRFGSDSNEVVIAGTNAGFILALSNTGGLLWRQRVDDVVTGVAVVDVDGDGANEVVAASRDRNIYVLARDGTVKWKYFVGVSLYSLKVADLDNNSLLDIIVSTTSNVTRFELSEYYVKKNRADYYYDLAYKAYNENKMTESMIYINKALELYNQIGDSEDVPRSDALLDKIKRGITLVKKGEADANYESALRFYAVNDFESATTYAQRAKSTYAELEDPTGIANVDSLLSLIDTELKTRRRFEGDAYYSKAVTFTSFGNFTAALENVRTARSIYGEVNYYEGTARCDTLTLSIADRNYDRAINSFELMNYDLALSYAVRAKEIYSSVGYYNGSAKADELIVKVNDAIKKGRTEKTGGQSEYLYYALGAAVVFVLVLAVSTARKRPAAARTMKPEDMEMISGEGASTEVSRQIRDEIRKELK